MPTTPVYAFRYPAGSAPPDVPTDMTNLATDVETLLNTKGVVSNATRTINQVPVWNGTVWVFSSVTTAMLADTAVTRLKTGARPMCRAQVTSNQSAPAANFSTVVFGSASQNTIDGTMWAVSPNPTRVVTPVAGWYIVGGSITLTGSSGGTDRDLFVQNSSGTRVAEWNAQAARDGNINTGTTIVQAAANDYFELIYYNDASTGGTIQASSRSVLWAAWIAP